MTVHSLNVPGLRFHIWPDGGSFEPKHVAEFLILITIYIYIVVSLTGINYYTGCLQKNGAVSKGNKEFISHLTRAQCTPSAAETVQVSHALPAVRFSCLMRRQFPRWRRSRKRLSACSVLRCPDL